uniref:Uncharacterized protein n=1 Tax=Anguilla anguilla TaxID=7936 RepID=A0A0E9S1I4_ANGAN
MLAILLQSNVPDRTQSNVKNVLWQCCISLSYHYITKALRIVF